MLILWHTKFRLGEIYDMHVTCHFLRQNLIKQLFKLLETSFLVLYLHIYYRQAEKYTRMIRATVLGVFLNAIYKPPLINRMFQQEFN